MSNTQYYPEHCRTSCDDESPINAEAGGSNGCARCTAIKLDERDSLLATMREIEAVLKDHPEVKKGNSKVHFAHCKALGAIQNIKGPEQPC